MAYIGFAPVGKPLTSNDLVDGIVTEAKLGSLAVTAGKIGAGAAVNFRGDGSTPLNSIMTTGNSISAAVMVTSTGSAYYINAVKVDGSAITPKVQGGSAIDAGNANSIDVYLFTIIKTGDAAFTILESQTQFA